MPIGNIVAINIGKFTNKIPAAPAPIIEAHSELGGIGLLGGVYFFFGRVMKNKNSSGPTSSAKYGARF